jgi:predicted nucleic acid-binding protein
MLTVDANIWVAAFDPLDRFHHHSRDFLAAVTQQGIALAGPTFVLVEVACALVRRAQNPATGKVAFERLRLHPLLRLQPLDDALLARAAELGVERLVRGADALYAATAQLHQGQLISWDDELIRCVGAITPADWLAANYPKVK